MRFIKLLLVLMVFAETIPGVNADRHRAAPSVTGPTLYPIFVDGITALSAAPDGSVWFAPLFWDPGFIGRLSPTGSETRVPIAGVASFLSVDSAGSVWFASRNSLGRVRGASVVEFPTSAGSISGLALDPFGQPWFTDRAANKVGYLRSVDADTVEFSLPEPLQDPSYIALGPDGKMWFVFRNGHIGSVTNEGAIEDHGFTELEGKPISAVVSTPDALWVAVACRECNRATCPYPNDRGLVARIAADHSLQVVADVGHNDLYALAADSAGTIYALEAILGSLLGPSAGPVLRIRTTGAVDAFQTRVHPNLSVPAGSLTTSPDGSVWGVYLGGGQGPVVFRFPAWQVR